MMKKVLIGLLIAFSLPAWAGDRHYYRNHGHYHQRHYNYNWVAPLVIGGVVGAVIANEAQRTQQPPVVVYQSAPTIETVVINGEVYVKQYIPVNGVYREVLIKQ